MRQSAFPRLARASAMLCIAALIQAGCSSEPTATSVGHTPELAKGVTASTIAPGLGGPDSIYKSGQYTYGASYNASYAQAGFFARGCTTLAVSTCTTTWTHVPGQQIDANHWQYTANLQYDCANNKKKSYQVRADFTAFGQPAQSVYKVTKLCGTDPRIQP